MPRASTRSRALRFQAHGSIIIPASIARTGRLLKARRAALSPFQPAWASIVPVWPQSGCEFGRRPRREPAGGGGLCPLGLLFLFALCCVGRTGMDEGRSRDGHAIPTLWLSSWIVHHPQHVGERVEVLRLDRCIGLAPIWTVRSLARGHRRKPFLDERPTRVCPLGRPELVLWHSDYDCLAGWSRAAFGL